MLNLKIQSVIMENWELAGHRGPECFETDDGFDGKKKKKRSKLLRLVQGKHGEYDRERSRREVEASGL